MTGENLKELENDLWDAADQLRSNSKLTATQYSIPVLGLIFLRHAYNRYLKAKAEIEKELPYVEGRGRRPLTQKDFKAKKAIQLPEKAQFKFLADLADDQDKGQALNDAMTAIEEDYEQLQGVLPKEYNKFSSDLLGKLLQIFNRESIAKAEGDVFGRIYEYFLNKFALSGAQEGGEFFTPPSLVNMIVQVIEPNHGLILDPACGSAGMFVQTAHFIEDQGKNPTEVISIIGQEKTEVNTRIGKMNLAVHGLEGKIVEGNTFYTDKHNVVGKCDFVMANPPFNVDGVDKEKDFVKNDKRIPFELPNNDNANYLWIQYFYGYLNATGRAGFVMASSAADAGHSEKAIRLKLIETGAIDVMVSITNNFFYTRSLPCALWFFDRAKENDAIRKEQVLMIDARSVFRKVSSKLNDFSPEQLANLSCIVALYRGNKERFTQLVAKYLNTLQAKGKAATAATKNLLTDFQKLNENLQTLTEKEEWTSAKEDLQKLLTAAKTSFNELQTQLQSLNDTLENHTKTFEKSDASNENQQKQIGDLEPAINNIQKLQKELLQYERKLKKEVTELEKTHSLRKNKDWKALKMSGQWKEWKTLREEAIKEWKAVTYFHQQCQWLQKRFPEGKYADVEGLCKITSRHEIIENDGSLNPGRYVGIAPIIDEDFDYESRMKEIKAELKTLNKEAVGLAKTIEEHLIELGI